MTGAGARAGTDGASLRFNADHAQAAGVAAPALHGALMGGAGAAGGAARVRRVVCMRR